MASVGKMRVERHRIFGVRITFDGACRLRVKAEQIATLPFSMQK